MTRVCAWCGKKLGTVPSRVHLDELITHGICEKCSFHLRAQAGMPLRAFLDGLGAPVLLVDSNGNIKTASKAARKLLRKDLPDIEGYKTGEVFECANAMLPGGCGKTIHCSGCTIRITVMDTLESGKSHEKVPTYLKQETWGRPQRLSLLVSTEKVGDVVLLRIDEMRVDQKAPQAEEIS